MGFSNKSKLLVVDDSAFMRKLISDFFVGNTKVEVVGTARNGKDAIKKIQSLMPDVVTMDVEMPELNGLDALKEIMRESPVPVIMLSSTTLQGAENALKAMEYGAVDFVAKPSGTISLDLHKIKAELVQKVEHAAHVSVTKLQKTNFTPAPIPKNQDIRFVNNPITQVAPIVNKDVLKKNGWNQLAKKIVLIGTSTGGPRALQEVITKLPSNIKAPILIVQHMPAGFTKSLSDRLNQLSQVKVKEAEDGDLLQNGVAYVAPGGKHLKLVKRASSYQVVLDQTEPPRSGHRPSVDVMFESVSKITDMDKVAVIMTGMGSDGSKGLMQLKQNGNVMAIAESEKTCIVYGMPKAAVETQLVNEIVDVDNIAEAIMKYLP
ncbi:protein-glutamate methylesterase/protein-glutamine glutaminase [Ureibacillus sinduriensis]|uniref:Protein-glutamate methylesterase/protein-glutamine glutaminase n=1 Tax=Ureibacillus sinduriensis BLB-1 = JCM 15800 TaxID=1384057 RepID=A0A0A3IGE2_9BACL|nr:chemotaxis response regulator protein-glutamate methylesterase [Ureibacillus sinduriensis]KGR73912.1 chemotaxis protein CheY [Ureibacillus sinduriensis BLB-1 = JCM 15800]